MQKICDKDLTLDEKRQKVSRFNVIDDTFFRVMMRDREVCEEILRILLQDSKLQVLEHHPQESLTNLNGKSVILDLYVKFSTGRYCNVEVQKENDDDHQKRVRYNATTLTSNIMPPGDKYKELPDVLILYISKFDMFRQKKTVYHVDRVIRETGTVITNGFEEIYINAAIDDGTDVAKLMQYFKDSNGTCEVAPKLAERVHMYKNYEEEVTEMCEIMKQERAEGRAEGKAEGLFESVIKLIKAGYDMTQACNMLEANIDEFKAYLEKQNT